VVPATVARLVLPPIVVSFLKAYPDIRLEVVVEDGFVDVLAAGCDAGIRYDERLEQDMIAVPIRPRVQRFATAASPGYLDARGRPERPRDLLAHACLRGQFASGATPAWEFERDGEVVRVDPVGPLVVRLGAAVDLALSAAVAGLGIIHLFEERVAAPSSGQRRFGAGAGALVAELLGAFPLLSGSSPSACIAPRFRRLHQEHTLKSQ
jgi:DNA-binding transcriptional LysR family regulator